MTTVSERKLGWPMNRLRRLSTGLGWPAEPVDPQVPASYPQNLNVSRETAAVPTPAPSAQEPAQEPAPERVQAAIVPQRRGERLPRPARTRVMVVANQKGGVGKTTTTVNIATALALEGLRTLVIDLDPQGNASTALAIEHPRGTPSSYDVLVDGASLTEVSQPHPQIANLVVVPATIDLAGAEIELVSVVARETRLRTAIAAHPLITGEIEDRFDYVFLDCPPSLGLLTLNALVAGAEMLIPIQAEYYALEGLGQLLETVEMVRAHLNAELEVSTILLTMYDSRTNLAAGVAGEVRAHFSDQVLRTAIPRSVRVSEAPSFGQSVITYDPGSPGALCYLEAARELAQRIKPGGTA
jgi:chromosome partitioning protein